MSENLRGDFFDSHCMPYHRQINCMMMMMIMMMMTCSHVYERQLLDALLVTDLVQRRCAFISLNACARVQLLYILAILPRAYRIIAIVCRPSVRLSVRLWRWGTVPCMAWSYKLGYFESNYTDNWQGLRSSEPQHRQSIPLDYIGNTTEFGWNRTGVSVFSRKPAITLKRGKKDQSYYWWLIGSRIRTFDWYRNQRPWMTLKGHYTPFQITCVFRSPPRKFEWR